MLYVTPERLAKSKRFMNALQKCYLANKLHLIAIDEGKKVLKKKCDLMYKVELLI